MSSAAPVTPAPNFTSGLACEISNRKGWPPSAAKPHSGCRHDDRSGFHDYERTSSRLPFLAVMPAATPVTCPKRSPCDQLAKLEPALHDRHVVAR